MKNKLLLINVTRFWDNPVKGRMLKYLTDRHSGQMGLPVGAGYRLSVKGFYPQHVQRLARRKVVRSFGVRELSSPSV